MTDDINGPSTAELGLTQKDLGVDASFDKSEEQKIQPSLEEELRIAYDQNFSTFGHGTRVEIINDILTTGLKTNVDKLGTTTVPLFDLSKSYDEQAREITEQITHWHHLDSKAVVLVMIPNKPKGLKASSIRYFDSVFKELPEDQKSMYAHYVIPSRYIRGIVNVDTKQLIPNPNFDPVIPEIKQQKIRPSEVTPGDSRGPVDIPTAISGQSEDFVF